MGEIENITDQIEGYADEVARAVQREKERHGYTTEQAIEIVRIASQNMQVECWWHRLKDKNVEINAIYDTLCDLQEYLEGK